jgi:predicted AAA+ superfamily ATPase
MHFLARLEAENGYKLDLKQVKKDIYNQGLSVLLASNPRNPTGQLIKSVLFYFGERLISNWAGTHYRGDELKELVEMSKNKTTIILDEVGANQSIASIVQERLLNHLISSTPGMSILKTSRNLDNRFQERHTSMVSLSQCAVMHSCTCS